MNIVDEKIWQEKYRPRTVHEVISVHSVKIMKQMENPKSMQNLLFYSRIGGTGKTSMAKAIIHELGCDYLPLNASDERSIDAVRTKVKDFCCSKSSHPETKRCVWMDEAEKLTKDAMDALKNMIETYSSNAFFIFTTNNIEKIPQPIQSRFNVMEFVAPDKVEIEFYLIDICKNENLKSETEGIKKLLDIHYPSIRCMVNHLQDLNLEGKDVTAENVTRKSKAFDGVWDLIKEKKYKEVRTKILEEGLDVNLFNKYIFDLMIESDMNWMVSAKVIKIIARNERDFKLGADEKITFIASIPEIMGVF